MNPSHRLWPFLRHSLNRGAALPPSTHFKFFSSFPHFVMSLLDTFVGLLLHSLSFLVKVDLLFLLSGLQL